MKNILNELERVEKMIENEPDFFINQKFWTDMEWWIIGHATKILQSVNERYPTYALKRLVPEFSNF